MAPPQRKKLSLDTNILLELADGGEVAADFRETFQANGYVLVATPRVVTELHLIESSAADQDARLATVALNGLRAWGIRPFDLSDISRAVARRFGEALIRNNLLPPEERGDARILAETAVAGVPGLVTFDRHLLDVDESELRLLLDAADLASVAIVHPRRLLRAMR